LEQTIAPFVALHRAGPEKPIGTASCLRQEKELEVIVAKEARTGTKEWQVTSFTKREKNRPEKGKRRRGDFKREKETEKDQKVTQRRGSNAISRKGAFHG